jgi:hypothetical protein
MKPHRTAHRRFSIGASRVWRPLACALTFVGATACTGAIGGDGTGRQNPNPTGTTGTSTGTGTTSSTTGVVPPPPKGVDPNRVAMHRLNNREYDNTMRDLMGVAANAAATFIDDEKVLGFDNIADAFGMTPAQYEQYFNAADALVETVFADAALRPKIMICAPSAATDTACMGKIISAFGLRAWRRPVTDAEVTRLVKVSADAIGLGEDTTGGIKQAIKSMLSSLPFLYRIEMDADPNSLVPHPLNAYELASRLSYLAWSTMPDDNLFGLAQTGQLVNEASLSAELDRLLADARVSNFVSSFAGQWLGMTELKGHQVEPTAFPDWNEPLRQAMIQEGLLYFQEFLMGGRSMKEFFTADVNFVNAPLSKLYGIPGSATDQPMKVTNTTDARMGFMGLASFLTFSSFTYRTAPTLRGKWVLENLLCEELPPPPAVVPKLDPAGGSMMAQSQNVRVRLEAHRSMPECAACHAVLDPIGMGLENFDGIGKYRAKYANGDAIDSSGVLPDKSTFKNLAELTAILSKPTDTRLLDCTSKTMMIYTLSRPVVATDDPYLQQIRQTWSGGNLGALLKQIVMNDTFRLRRGEPM